MIVVGLVKVGYYVFIGCCFVIKVEKVVDYIYCNSGNKNVEFLFFNLVFLNLVYQFVDLFLIRKFLLYILINNVGIFNYKGIIKEGFELIWGINYLGYFFLIYFLLEKFKSFDFSRIIIVVFNFVLKLKGIFWNLLVKKIFINFLEFYFVFKLCLLFLINEFIR